MDYCFHVFISVSFLAVHSFLPKILCRVTKNFGKRDFLTADYADGADKIFKTEGDEANEGSRAPAEKTLVVFLCYRL